VFLVTFAVDRIVRLSFLRRPLVTQRQVAAARPAASASHASHTLTRLLRLMWWLMGRSLGPMVSAQISSWPRVMEASR
jgi:hypothetical protein